MRFTRFLSGAALAAMLVTTAGAQPAAPSAEKIALARQLVDASGGADQMKTLLQTVFGGMSATLSANVPPEQKRLTEVLLQKMQERFIAATPQMIDGTVQVYATNLSDKELRDYVAWLQSDTGQSLKRKMPMITAESVRVMAPVLTQVTQGIKQDVLDEACKQANCTPHDREVLAAAMDKAMPARPPARQPG
jgi:hypothetical protein